MARLLRHVLIVTLLAGATMGAAWSLEAPTADQPAVGAAEAHGTQAPARSHDRERFAGDLSGYRFIAAELGRVRPVASMQEVMATVETVVPTQTGTSVDGPDAGARTVWDRLADCESGDWRDGTPQPGTARWDYGLTFSHGDSFEGGVNFHPRTWESYKDPGMADHAGHATRAQQIAIAERVLADQGWGAWPVCSRMLGLR